MLRAVFLEEIFAGMYFDVRMVSTYKLIQQLTLFVNRTQDLKDRLDYDKEEDLMTHQIMMLWLKHQLKLIHDYSLVGYTLSPHP